MILVSLIAITHICTATEEARLNFLFDGIRGVEISGTFEPNARVFLQVIYLENGLPLPNLKSTDVGSSLVYFVDSVVANQNGSYKIHVKMSDVSGIYIFRTNSENGVEPAKYIFNYRSPFYVEEIIEKLNDAIEQKKADAVADLIDLELSALEPDGYYYQKATEDLLFSSVCEILVEMDTITDKEDFQKKFLQAVLLTYFNKTTNTTVLDMVLQYCANAAGFSNQSFYNKTFLKILSSETTVKVMQSLMASAPYSKNERFIDKFKLSVIMDGIRYSAWGTVQLLLEENGSDISNTVYARYQSLKTAYPGYYANVAKELAGSVSSGISDISLKWSVAIDNALLAANLANSNYTPSIGGGSSSGSKGATGVFENSTENKLTTINTNSLPKYFDDLDGVEWAKESINALAEKNFINGKEARLFYPQELITRAEFLTILMKAYGLMDENAKCTFEDVAKNTWFYKTVASAYERGITNGISENYFGAESSIKREDLCVFAYKTMLLSGDLKTENTISTFTDYSDIDYYALEAVNALCSLGVINGMGDGSFAPLETATRAQAAKIIYNILSISENGV